MNSNKYPFLIVLLLAAMACKKEEVEAPYPYNSILAFSVPVEGSSTGEITAAIYDHTLTLYWPDYLERPDSVTPGITVSARATVSPASGTRVPLKDGVTFTVAAQDGQTAQYTLRLVINQKEPKFSATEVSIPLYSRYAAAGLVYDLQPDKQRTQLYMVSAAGTEHRMPVLDVTRQGIVFYADAYDGSALDTGWYKVKVVNADKTAISSGNLVHLAPDDPAPYIFEELTDTLVLQRGASFTMPVRYLEGFEVTRVRLGAPNLEIVSAAAGSVTLRVPDDFEPGLYDSFRLYASQTATGRSTNRFAYLGAFNIIKVTE
ncbi:DUF5018 domain-containing protein [Chitinophaga japonensis]|uniref:DUF5018 domain-containing protein n=1 Tax=Chitinophaga japonensis TaxID=104662 RepID=A0A562TC16_CHIJA|nr:hypothetical protein [Chitinophaga japonensis]TWI91045.1 hypothetical protein LX66_0406 [Chitinophaga japonensis]